MRPKINRSLAALLAVVLGASLTLVGCGSSSNSSGPEPTATGDADNNFSTSVALTKSLGSIDPSKWSDRKLAAQLVLAGVASKSVSRAKPWAKSGVAGIVLFGAAPNNLRNAIAGVRANSPGKRLVVASDEEGGSVQRMTRLIGKYPSAAQIGRTKTVKQTQALANGLGKKLKRLGVNSDLAPVADLLYPGSWTARDGRAFKKDPKQDGKYVAAFAKGLQAAGVSSTLKHWPGGGASADTHVGKGKTPTWSKVQARDLVPFNTALKAGASSVMISHAQVPGLTGKIPASQSTKAYRELRKRSGLDTVIMTDSLGMKAVTGGMKQSPAMAAVRAIRTGADLALVQVSDPYVVINKIAKAIKSGKINRNAAVASAKRVIAWQLAYQR